MSVADFTAHKHPVLAVACPDASCRARVGVWCKRPSGHKATDLHKARKQAADRAWLKAGAPFLRQRDDGRAILAKPRNAKERADHRRTVENTEFILEHFGDGT